jgi:hypothetical protein
VLDQLLLAVPHTLDEAADFCVFEEVPKGLPKPVESVFDSLVGVRKVVVAFDEPGVRIAACQKSLARFLLKPGELPVRVFEGLGEKAVEDFARMLRRRTELRKATSGLPVGGKEYRVVWAVVPEQECLGLARGRLACRRVVL